MTIYAVTRMSCIVNNKNNLSLLLFIVNVLNWKLENTAALCISVIYFTGLSSRTDDAFNVNLS